MMDPYIIVIGVLNVILVLIIYVIVPRYAELNFQNKILTWIPLGYSTLHLVIDILFSQSHKFSVVFVILLVALFFICLYVIIPRYEPTDTGSIEFDSRDKAITDLIVVTNVAISIIYFFLSKNLRSEFHAPAFSMKAGKR